MGNLSVSVVPLPVLAVFNPFWLPVALTLAVMKSGIWFLLLLQLGSIAALKDELKNLAVSLFRDLSDPPDRMLALISESKSTFPAESVARIYENFTRQQLDALESELATHQHFIYRPLKAETKSVKSEFEKWVLAYRADGDLAQFEQRFLQVGNRLISVQKLILRIINSGLEQKLTSPRQESAANQRSLWSVMFDQLRRLFFGELASLDRGC